MIFKVSSNPNHSRILRCNKDATGSGRTGREMAAVPLAGAAPGLWISCRHILVVPEKFRACLRLEVIMNSDRLQKVRSLLRRGWHPGVGMHIREAVMERSAAGLTFFSFPVQLST